MNENEELDERLTPKGFDPILTEILDRMIGEMVANEILYGNRAPHLVRQREIEDAKVMEGDVDWLK